jgi:hypothetical protein
MAAGSWLTFWYRGGSARLSSSRFKVDLPASRAK